MKKVNFFKLIGILGLVSFITGIVCAILSFTIGISIYFSFCFVTLGFILVIVSSKTYRTYELKVLDNYINLHSCVDCPKCHTLNDIDANFCKNCGKKLH